MSGDQATTSNSAADKTCQQIVEGAVRIRSELNHDLDDLQQRRQAPHSEGVALLELLLTNVNALIGHATAGDAKGISGGGLERDEY